MQLVLEKWRRKKRKTDRSSFEREIEENYRVWVDHGRRRCGVVVDVLLLLLLLNQLLSVSCNEVGLFGFCTIFFIFFFSIISLSLGFLMNIKLQLRHLFLCIKLGLLPMCCQAKPSSGCCWWLSLRDPTLITESKRKKGSPWPTELSWVMWSHYTAQVQRPTQFEWKIEQDPEPRGASAIAHHQGWLSANRQLDNNSVWMSKLAPEAWVWEEEEALAATATVIM